MTQEIVILGAGYAGVQVAKRLAKQYKNDDSISITLIDRHSYHTMMTGLHEVAADRVKPDAIQYDLRKLFNRTKVNLVTDTVTDIDHKQQIVVTDDGEYPFDYLVIGMGSEPDDLGIPGVREHTLSLWSKEDAIKLKHHIEETVKKASVVHDKKTRQKMLTFAVCGSGFTGVELVGELLEWKNRLAYDHKISPESITLYIIERDPSILKFLDPKDSTKAETYLLKKGVKILKESPIVEVTGDEIHLESGEVIPTCTPIWAGGIKANNFAKSFNMNKGPSGRIEVNQYLESTSHEHVYVAGDLAYFEEKPNQPNPRNAESAKQMGKTIAKNITASINETKKIAHQHSNRGAIVSIGSRYGVANLMGFHLSGWFAMVFKHLMNLFYLLSIGSGYYTFKYVEREFFYTTDKRNIFRDFFNRYGNALWAVPLRIYLGLFWLVEGASKLWGESVWTEATSTLSNVGLLFRGLGEDSWLISSTVQMDTSWLQFTFLPSNEMAMFVQRMMIFVEIGFGLFLILGLLTSLVSTLSALLILGFAFTQTLEWDQLWALPASIALLNGAGHTAGLDYWFVPFIQRLLGQWWYGKEKAIYKDK